MWGFQTQDQASEPHCMCINSRELALCPVLEVLYEYNVIMGDGWSKPVTTYWNVGVRNVTVLENLIVRRKSLEETSVGC